MGVLHRCWTSIAGKSIVGYGNGGSCGGGGGEGGVGIGGGGVTVVTYVFPIV